jgi:acetyltransferase-like isoleucine patch superfamily enzyme
MKFLKLLLRGNRIKNKGQNKLELKGKLKNNKIRVSGKNNILEIKNDSRLVGCDIYIKGSNNRIIIGKNCDINNSKILLDTEEGVITIGDKTTIGGAMIVSLEPYPITIGENCMISYDVEIRNTDSHEIIDLNTKKRINDGKAVEIMKNVWLGAGSRILKGVTLEEGAIVAMGSLVTKKVMENTVVGGVPAKLIKNNCTWTRKEVNFRG